MHLSSAPRAVVTLGLLQIIRNSVSYVVAQPWRRRSRAVGYRAVVLGIVPLLGIGPPPGGPKPSSNHAAVLERLLVLEG